MKILIVDDDPFSRRLLQGYLQGRGHETVAAGSGPEALSTVQADPDVSILITDWMMPGMDGLELCRAARVLQRRRYLPILLVTARGERQDLVAGLNAGADAFLSKPVDFAELQAHLQVAERVLRLEDEVAAAAEERAQLRELRAITATARTLTDRINNAMMVIFTQCERLRGGAASLPPERAAEAADRIFAAATGVSEVVHDLERVVRPVMSEVPGVGAMLNLRESTSPGSGAKALEGLQNGHE